MSTDILNNTLPWAGDGSEDRRFERVLLSVLGPMLILAVIIPLLPLIKLAIEQVQEPPIEVKLVVPPPPKPIALPAAAPKPLPQPVPAEARHKEKPSPAPIPAPSPEAARDRAARTGIIAAAKELNSLRDSEVITTVESQRQLNGPVAAGKSSSADLSALQASRNSGGINTSGIGTKGTGTTLSDYAPGTGGTGAGSTGAGSQGGGGVGRRGAYAPSRSPESIQIVFDRNKAAFDALYARALRDNADLRGVLTLEITILPSGRVVSCRVISSELHNPELEAKVASRVQLLEFGAQDVPTVTVKYPLRFFPT